MATIKKTFTLLLMWLMLTANASAHKIYAPNDIPLLDNRFRIDPDTQQVTIILNHEKTPQKIVIVRPDGSKWYAERHPKDEVAWMSNQDQDIITVQNPMPGPWQAIATLHGENRIQLLNPITLHVEKLPLKLYHNEYLTTHVSLLQDNEVLKGGHFLENAKLTVSLLSPANRLISQYKDDGRHYDALSFDGKLSTHLFIDLAPGRYLLNIKTQNNIFIRTYNKDAIVFPSPVVYQLLSSFDDDEMAELSFTFDKSEVIADSITVDGLFSSNNGSNDKQSIIHFSEHQLEDEKIIVKVPLAHDLYKYTAKVYATTTSGREISFQLPERIIELLPPIQPLIMNTGPSGDIASQALTSSINIEENVNNGDDTQEEQQSSYLWWLLGGLAVLIILGIVVAIILLKRKSKGQQVKELSLDELTDDDLQPTEIDINSVKNNRDDE